MFRGLGVVKKLAVLACVLRATTKKVIKFLREKRAPPRENPGYADARDGLCGGEFAHSKELADDEH